MRVPPTPVAMTTIFGYTLIHVGFAIGRLDEAEAQRTLRFLKDEGLFATELGDTATEGGP